MTRQRRVVQVVALDDRARRALSRRHPELAGFGNAVVVAAHPEFQQPVNEIVEELARRANNGEALARERLVDELLAKVTVPTPELIERARRQALQRERLLHDFGGLIAFEVAEATGSAAENRAQVAYRWRRDGRIFGVRHRGVTYYLAFQFDETGEPRPVVREVLRALAGWDPWDIAVWFAQPHPMLAHRAPAACGERDNAAVITAARHDHARASS